MLLAIDIGNTNIHFGLWDEQRWRTTWRARTVANKMGDEYAVLLRNFLHSSGLHFEDVKQVVMASVVPVLTDAFRELVPRYFQTDVLNVTHLNAGIAIEIDLPQQVGADRIVNAVAVNKLYGGGPAIVIDFGTATTFDVISRDGAYIGGAISPGINVALEALVSRTAQLYKVELVPPPSPIGKNTAQALQSGLFLGYVGLVEGLTKKLIAALPDSDQDSVKVIATGGLAPLFNQYTDVIHIISDSLTLDGMRVIWELNHNSG